MEQISDSEGIMACGFFIVVLGYTLASSNIIMKWFGLICLAVGEILCIAGAIGEYGLKEGLSSGFLCGALAACSVHSGRLFGRLWNKPNIIKWSYRAVAIVMALACIATLFLTKK